MRETTHTLRRGRAVAVFVCLLVGAPAVARACSVCFGNPDSPHTQGMNNAILFLLAVIGAVLACFAAFFLHLRRMSRLARAGHGSGFTQGWPPPGRSSPGGSSHGPSSGPRGNGSSRNDGLGGARF